MREACWSDKTIQFPHLFIYKSQPKGTGRYGDIVMKKLVLLFIYIICLTTIINAQSLQKLESDPSFKGITIGMLISDVPTKLNLETISNGYKVYRITDAYYLSVFNIKLDEMLLLERNGKVYRIEGSRTIKYTGGEVFDFEDSLFILKGLTRIYGPANYSMDEKHSTYNRTGLRWISKTKQAVSYMDYYGAFEGYTIVFSIGEYHEDF